MFFSKLFQNSLFQSIPQFRKALSSVIGKAAWLSKAMPLKAYKSEDERLKQLVDEIYSEVIQHIEVKNPTNTKKAIKTILINLWMGAFFNRPIRYSRNNNNYSSVRRYGLLFMTKGFLLSIIDTFEKLGYIKQKMGFFVFDKGFGRQTRMWVTETLTQRFEDTGICDYDFFTSDRPKEPIILKDSNKCKIQYVDDRKTNKWRAQLEQYNSCKDSSVITVVLNSLVPVTIRFLIQFLYQYVIKGTVRINTVNLTQLYPTHSNTKYYFNTKSIQYHYLLSTINILSTMTKKKHWKQLPLVPIDELTNEMMLHHYLADLLTSVRAFDNFDHANTFLNQTVLLKDIGIEHLEFQLTYEYLHRVFNDSSFSRGGRFYGALHLSLPRDLRQYIYIDAQPTVELDYSALHIKMLYHMAGIDYQSDPYSACEGPDLRKVYKAVALIAINAENEKKAYGAITDELKDRGLKAPARKRHIASLVDIFKQTHLPIQKHLFSGVGTRLQNIDSNIMNSILARLLELDIVGLPVHDSVIVQAQHKDILESIMMKEYEKQIGFKPVVDIK